MFHLDDETLQVRALLYESGRWSIDTPAFLIGRLPIRIGAHAPRFSRSQGHGPGIVRDEIQ